MDAVSYSHSAKQAKRIEKIINEPDSISGVVTVPNVIAVGESVTVPVGRTAVLPNVQVDGTLTVDGDVFVPSGTSTSVIDSKLATKADTTYVNNKPSGFKNYIINGDKRVNQRAYTGGVLANGVYGYDRWKGADSDVNIEQIIEQQNIVSGTYTISFTGGGTATVAGISGLSSGDSVTITVSSDISVKVPKGAGNIQLEKGSVATPFEQRPYGLELSLCQRYYQKAYHIIYIGANVNYQYIQLTQDMRVNPTVTTTNATYFGSSTAHTVSAGGTTGTFRLDITSGTGYSGGQFYFTVDAEL